MLKLDPYWWYRRDLYAERGPAACSLRLLIPETLKLNPRSSEPTSPDSLIFAVIMAVAYFCLRWPVQKGDRLLLPFAALLEAAGIPDLSVLAKNNLDTYEYCINDRLTAQGYTNATWTVR